MGERALSPVEAALVEAAMAESNRLKQEAETVLNKAVNTIVSEWPAEDRPRNASIGFKSNDDGKLTMMWEEPQAQPSNGSNRLQEVR